MVRIKNTTSEIFRELILKKDVICLCAGEDFKNFIMEYKDVDFNLLYILDNYYKQKTIEVNGKKYDVRSFEEKYDEIQNAIVILASDKYAEEIIRQIDEIPIFDNQVIYIPKLFEPTYSYYDFSDKGSSVIPKKIHYCWFGHTEIPKSFIDNIETWKKYCPDYEIIKWDENNYDLNKNKYMRAAYEKKMYAYVSDYARLDVIYQYGGIYLDVDVEMLRPWDDLLSFPFFCGYEDSNYVNCGLGYGAIKGNVILEELLNEYDNMQFPNIEEGEELIPCPIYQTKILRKHGLLCDGMSRKYDDFLVLSPVYFNSVNNMIGIGQAHNESFSVHQYAGSWLDDEKKENKKKKILKYRFLMDHLD